MDPIASQAGKAYLNRSSGVDGQLNRFLAAPEILRLVLDDPVSCVRHGGSAALRTWPRTILWLRFAKAMSPMARLAAKRAAFYLAASHGPPATLLDVAPHLADVTVVVMFET